MWLHKWLISGWQEISFTGSKTGFKQNALFHRTFYNFSMCSTTGVSAINMQTDHSVSEIKGIYWKQLHTEALWTNTWTPMYMYFTLFTILEINICIYTTRHCKHYSTNLIQFLFHSPKDQLHRSEVPCKTSHISFNITQAVVVLQ